MIYAVCVPVCNTHYAPSRPNRQNAVQSRPNPNRCKKKLCLFVICITCYVIQNHRTVRCSFSSATKQVSISLWQNNRAMDSQSEVFYCLFLTTNRASSHFFTHIMHSERSKIVFFSSVSKPLTAL